MWIDIPVLKNTWTGEVELAAVNMSYCTLVERFHYVEPDQNLHEDEKRLARSHEKMKTALRLTRGDDTWVVYSPWEYEKIRSLMNKEQTRAVTPTQYTE